MANRFPGPMLPQLPELEINIIEGPAGAGKTTFAKFLTSRKPTAYIVKNEGLPRPRSYDGYQGEVLAIMKDMYSIAEILGQESQVAIIDRWLISSWVYNQIRRGFADNPNYQELIGILTAGIGNVENLLTSLTCRGNIKPTSIVFNWYFLIPPMNIINQRRLECGKLYSYKVDEEYNLYGSVIQFLKETPSTPSWLQNIYLVGREGDDKVEE